MPHAAACMARMRRLVALSSTISRRLPRSSGWLSARKAGAGADVSAGGVRTVKWKVDPLPAPALSTHIVPPISSLRRLLMASPSPVPP